MSMEVKRRLAPSFLPATAVLEMTYRCNHTCLFCSCPWFAPNGEYSMDPELSLEEWKGVIRTLCGMGVTNIAFTGGEPLLKEGILELIEFAGNCTTEHIESVNGRLVSRFGQPNLYLLSNGKAMSNEVLELCRRCLVNLSMSLPGLKTFSEHTQGGEAKNVLNWFHKAHNLGVTTTVGVTVTKKNLHELYECIARALLAGADNLLMNRFMPGGRGLVYAEELSLTKEEVCRMLETAETVLRAANRRGSVGTELPKCLVNQDKFTNLQIGTRCSAALEFFVVDPSGYLRVCNHSTVRVGHVNEIERVKDHPYWKQFVFKDYLPSACASCDRAGVCDGGCREAAHIVGGSVGALDPLLIEWGKGTQSTKKRT